MPFKDVFCGVCRLTDGFVDQRLHSHDKVAAYSCHTRARGKTCLAKCNNGAVRWDTEQRDFNGTFSARSDFHRVSCYIGYIGLGRLDLLVVEAAVSKICSATWSINYQISTSYNWPMMPSLVPICLYWGLGGTTNVIVQQKRRDAAHIVPLLRKLGAYCRT